MLLKRMVAFLPVMNPEVGAHGSSTASTMTPLKLALSAHCTLFAHCALQFALLGEAVDLTYKYDHLGSDPAALAGLIGSPFMDKLKGAKNPAVIVGPGVLGRPDRDALLKHIHTLVEKAGQWEDDCVFVHMSVFVHMHVLCGSSSSSLCAYAYVYRLKNVFKIMLMPHMRV